MLHETCVDNARRLVDGIHECIEADNPTDELDCVRVCWGCNGVGVYVGKVGKTSFAFDGFKPSSGIGVYVTVLTYLHVSKMGKTSSALERL